MSRATRPEVPPASAAAIEALYATGYWLFTRGDVAHAQSVFRAMIHLAPHDERAWLALGACYEAERQPDLALSLYGSATEMASAPRCEIARARILRSRGREHEARRALARAAISAHELQDEELHELVESEWAGGRPR
jgi:Flp pilus assembly protein TadD